MEIKKPVENVLEETLKNIKNLIDVDLIIGKTITIENLSVIPISKVTIGFVSGGGEYANNKKMKNLFNLPFAGGSGGGCNISPMGFLILDEKGVNFVKINDDSNFKKFVDLTGDFLEKMK